MIKKRLFSLIAALLLLASSPALATATTHYGYTLPVVGGNTNAWGTLLNTNISTLDTDLYNAAFGKTAWGGVAGGTANALTFTVSPALTAYADGLVIRGKSGASANTASATVNFNALGALTIYRTNESTTLSSGDIPANTDVEFLLKTTGGNKAILLGSTTFSTLTVTGNASVGGTLGVTGNVAVNTNKFNITASSGNTAIAGTLGVTGDVAVNTNKFNVTSSSGNTSVGGTLTSLSHVLVGGTTLLNPTSTMIAGSTLYATGATVHSGDGLAALRLQRLTSDGVIALFYRDTAQVGDISITASTTSYNTSSDRRLKKNIQPITNSGSILDSVNPVSYDWKNSSEHGIGFIAQDLYPIVPQAVTHGDNNQNLKYGDPGFEQWRVDYSKLVPYLVAEIKSLRLRVEQLERRP